MEKSKTKMGNVYPFPKSAVRRYRARARARPTPAQKAWLRRGLDQPGGKLPLFDEEGQHYLQRTIRSCIDQGWAEPWFHNPLKPDWTVCRLTDAGRRRVGGQADRKDPAPKDR